jgi:hypothetical protein
MGDVRWQEEVNDTCVKTVHVGTMGRGFTTLKITFYTTLHYTTTREMVVYDSDGVTGDHISHQ